VDLGVIPVNTSEDTWEVWARRWYDLSLTLWEQEIAQGFPLLKTIPTINARVAMHIVRDYPSPIVAARAIAKGAYVHLLTKWNIQLDKAESEIVELFKAETRRVVLERGPGDRRRISAKKVAHRLGACLPPECGPVERMEELWVCHGRFRGFAFNTLFNIDRYCSDVQYDHGIPDPDPMKPPLSVFSVGTYFGINTGLLRFSSIEEVDMLGGLIGKWVNYFLMHADSIMP